MLTPKPKIGRRTLLLFGVSFVWMLVSLYLIFMWAPETMESAGGVAQRIFYFHVPLAFVAFLSFFHVFISSIAYLRTGLKKWDNLAYCSAEIGVIFTSLVLISGSIWAKPSWGRWWVWEDQRLVLTLVLWLIYVGYLLVRSYAAERAQGARFSAVVGIIGFLDVPLVFMAIRWWKTPEHPVVLRSGGIGWDILMTLLISVAAFFLFYTLLLKQRYALKQQSDELEELQDKIENRGD